VECLRFTGVFQLHAAPKSHYLVSQPLTKQPNVYTQLPLSLQTVSSLPESSSCAWGSSSRLNPSSFFCCWWWFWGTFFLFFGNGITKQILLAQKQVISMRVRENLIYHHLNILPLLCRFSRGEGLHVRTHSSVSDHMLGTWAGVRDTALPCFHDCYQTLILCPPGILYTSNLPREPQSPFPKGTVQSEVAPQELQQQSQSARH